MKHLFDHWKAACRTLGPLEKVLWVFDFDGTLAPIARRPQEATLPQSTKRLLVQLSRRYPGQVCILSGRRLREIRDKMGIPGLIYGGTHGFEIEGPRIRWHHQRSSKAKQRLRTLVSWIQCHQKDVSGFRLEDKGWTLCLHYREVRAKDLEKAKAVLNDLQLLASSLSLAVQRGKKTLEIFSDAYWNKGTALRLIQRRMRARGVFYVGDDTTDESIFSLRAMHQVSVRVGRSKKSEAPYYVTRQEESPKLLQRIISL